MVEATIATRMHQRTGRYQDMPPETILRFVPFHKIRKAADIGCGKGMMTEALLSRISAHGEVLALDLDAAKLEALRKNLSHPALMLLQSDASFVPLRDNSLDLVVMAFVLHEAARKKPLLQEAIRILKPGGYFLIVEWQKQAPGGTAYRTDRIGKADLMRMLENQPLQIKVNLDSNNKQTYIIVAKKTGGYQ